jgi:hypothetical protein
MKLECDMCKAVMEFKDYNTFSLEGIDYNIKKVICNTCAKGVAKILAKNDKRVINHKVMNIMSEDGMVFRLTVTVDDVVFFTRDFDSYVNANNFILPLVKLKNRYSKQVMLDRLSNEMR